MLRNRRRIVWAAGIAAAASLLALALMVTFGVSQRHRDVTLPTPTGPYAVGRVLYDWTDESRKEMLAPQADGLRALNVWIWYPADPEPDATPADYLPESWADARDRARGLGSMLFQAAPSIHAEAYADAPVSRGETTYPVLIFEPGLGPAVSDYTALLEELAGQGYVVIGVNPTYSTAEVVFADGQVAEQTASGSIPDNASATEARQIGDQLVQVWAGDMRFAMDQAQRLNADPQSPFAGRLDLTRIGVFGHSFGGAAAAETCHLDARCRAGANLDGYPYGDVVQTGLQQPFLFLWSGGADASDAHYQQALRDIGAIYQGLETGYQVSIRGARHFNFTDYAVEFAPMLRVLGLLGPIDGQRGLRISSDYVTAFFDAYLKGGDPSRLTTLAAEYGEVEFDAWRK